MEQSQTFDPTIILNKYVSRYCSSNKFPVQQCKLFRDGFTYSMHAIILSWHKNKWEKRDFYTQELLIYQWVGICPQWDSEVWKQEIWMRSSLFQDQFYIIWKLKNGSIYLFIVVEHYILQWQILSWNREKQGPWKHTQNINQLRNLQTSPCNIWKIKSLFAGITVV